MEAVGDFIFCPGKVRTGTRLHIPHIPLHLFQSFSLSFQMIQAIQVLRFHLLELEKVGEMKARAGS